MSVITIAHATTSNFLPAAAAFKTIVTTAEMTKQDLLVLGKIETQLIKIYAPKLAAVLKSYDTARLYDVVPDIQHFMNSESLEWLEKCDNPQKVVAAVSDIKGISELQQNISEATQRMESFAQANILERLRSLDDAGKTSFIRAMGMPGTDFNCPITNFERIPELQQERIVGEISERSHVLILGTGSVSISGLYFASFGAQVTLVDRDPRAIKSFEPIYNALPRAIQKRLTLSETCDARDYKYPDGITHICLAALLEPKEPVINRLSQMYNSKNSATPPKILLRLPRKDLMRFFYYGVDQESLNGFEVLSKIDIGHLEQPANTFVLKIKQDFKPR